MSVTKYIPSGLLLASLVHSILSQRPSSIVTAPAKHQACHSTCGLEKALVVLALSTLVSFVVGSNSIQYISFFHTEVVHTDALRCDNGHGRTQVSWHGVVTAQRLWSGRELGVTGENLC